MPVELVVVLTAVISMGFLIKILASGVIEYGDLAGLMYFLLINGFALLPFYIDEYGTLSAEVFSMIMLFLSVTTVLAFREEDEVWKEF